MEVIAAMTQFFCRAGIPCLLFFVPIFATAGNLTAREREMFDVKMAAAAYTLEQKNLPVRLINSLKTQERSVEDKRMLTEALADWPKSFSPDVKYYYGGTRFELKYKEIPIAGFQILKLNPRTVLINSKTEVSLEKGKEISALLKALSKSGYRISNGEFSFWDWLWPRAWAIQLAGSTFRNSIILSAATVLAPDNNETWTEASSPAEDYTKSLVRDGYLLPKAGLEAVTHYLWGSTKECNGESIKGTALVGGVGRTPKEGVEFEASRTGGIIFDADGKKIIGKPTRPGAPGSTVRGSCDRLEHAGASLDTKLAEARQSCEQIKALKPESGLACGFNRSNYRQLCAGLDAMTIVPPVRFQLCENSDCTSSVPISANDTVDTAFEKESFRNKFHGQDFATEEKKMHRLQEAGAELSEDQKLESANITQIEEQATGGHGFGAAAMAVMGMLDCCMDNGCRDSLKKDRLTLVPNDPARASK